MKKCEYTFEYCYNGKGKITVAADSLDEGVEKAAEAVQDLLPDDADKFSVEIGDLLSQETICAGMEMM